MAIVTLHDEWCSNGSTVEVDTECEEPVSEECRQSHADSVRAFKAAFPENC